MVETVIAVLIITSLFLVLFKLSYMLTAKILTEHAAMRVARARAVGMNDFMCKKTARVSVIPAAGKRTWPQGDTLDYGMELARIPIYLQTRNGAIANGVLEYEGWNRLAVDPGDGTDTKVRLGVSLFDGTVEYELDGEAAVEDNYTLYMNNQGR